MTHCTLECSYQFIFTLLCFRWSVNFVYMGLTMNVTNISGDLYLNMFILFLVEIPGNYVCMKLIDTTRLGRRWTVGGSIAIAGISLLLVAAIPKGIRYISISQIFTHLRAIHTTLEKSYSFALALLHTANLSPPSVVGILVFGTCI